MSKPMNKLAVNIVVDAIGREKELQIASYKVAGATIVDMGLKTPGGWDAGLILSKICLGGLGEVKLTSFNIDGIILPAVMVYTDYPVESCMASQLAGWRIKVGDFFANASGPARALARKPKKLYEELGYSEVCDEAVLVLETEMYPNEDVVKFVSESTGVKPDNLYLVIASSSSIAGSIQISARIVETGLHKFHTLGFNIKSIKYGFGICPIAPLHPNPMVMLGKTNDMLLYGGSTFYMVDFDDDNKLKEFVEKSPSSTSRDYGKSFTELVLQVGVDFLYKLDPSVFAPAVVVVNNIKTGSTFKSGFINYEILRKAIGL
ncbi:MAG: methenyltetrahydromethanopterin cyclohydrolase [Candidatus Methanomethylicia archaeon]